MNCWRCKRSFKNADLVAWDGRDPQCVNRKLCNQFVYDIGRALGNEPPEKWNTRTEPQSLEDAAEVAARVLEIRTIREHSQAFHRQGHRLQ